MKKANCLVPAFLYMFLKIMVLNGFLAPTYAGIFIFLFFWLIKTQFWIVFFAIKVPMPNNQKVLLQSFMEIDKNSLDNDGFPSELTVSFSHEGQITKRQLRKDSSTSPVNVFTVENENLIKKRDLVGHSCFIAFCNKQMTFTNYFVFWRMTTTCTILMTQTRQQLP